MRTERQGSSKLDTKRVALLIGLVALFLQTAVHLQGQQFRSLGKRDPFLNLTRVMQKEEPTLVTPPLAQRPPGLPGLLVSEVIVTGMAGGEVSKVVLLRGVDNFTYLAHEDSKLFDGYISEIARDEVVFVREVFDARGQKQVSKVVKRLYTEEN